MYSYRSVTSGVIFIIVIFLMIFLHEFGHWLVATYLGYRAELLFLLGNYGALFVCRVYSSNIPLFNRLMIAAAGPLFSSIGLMMISIRFKEIWFLVLFQMLYLPLEIVYAFTGDMTLAILVDVFVVVVGLFYGGNKLLDWFDTRDKRW